MAGSVGGTSAISIAWTGHTPSAAREDRAGEFSDRIIEGYRKAPQVTGEDAWGDLDAWTQLNARPMLGRRPVLVLSRDAVLGSLGRLARVARAGTFAGIWRAGDQVL